MQRPCQLSSMNSQASQESVPTCHRSCGCACWSAPERTHTYTNLLKALDGHSVECDQQGPYLDRLLVQIVCLVAGEAGTTIVSCDLIIESLHLPRGSGSLRPMTDPPLTWGPNLSSHQEPITIQQERPPALGVKAQKKAAAAADASARHPQDPPSEGKEEVRVGE